MSILLTISLFGKLNNNHNNLQGLYIYKKTEQKL